jgi:hypothetical protein
MYVYNKEKNMKIWHQPKLHVNENVIKNKVYAVQQATAI